MLLLMLMLVIFPFMKNIDNLRIRKIPRRVARCAICGTIAPCYYHDADLCRYICIEDSAHVMAAELLLLRAGLEIPSDSILDSDRDTPAGL